MSRWIDADRWITVQLYDGMHEEWSVENMTIAEYLDRYTEEGCPSAKQEWIPCSERLPEIGQKVLASTKKTVFTQVFKGYHSDPKRWAWEKNSVKRIEAWQPLPKPWEGTEDMKGESR